MRGPVSGRLLQGSQKEGQGFLSKPTAAPPSLVPRQDSQVAALALALAAPWNDGGVVPLVPSDQPRGSRVDRWFVPGALSGLGADLRVREITSSEGSMTPGEGWD